VRPNPGTDWLDLRFRAESLPPGKYRLVGHAGFAGGAGLPNGAQVRVSWNITRMAGPGASAGIWPGTLPVISNPTGIPQPLVLFNQDFDTATVGPAFGQYRIRCRIRFTFPGGPPNPAYPPALFGVRLLPN